jgi:Outer membrane protein
MKILKLIVILLCIVPVVNARQTWTLQECIDRAKAANLTIREKQLSVQQANIALKTAQCQRLPSLSGSLHEGYNMGLSPSASGVYSQSNASAANLSVSISLPLFTGFRIRNGIISAKCNLNASKADKEQAQQDLVIDVMAAYLQILLDKELTRSAQEQVNLSSKQADKARRMIQVGKLSRSELYDSQAQLAKDSASLIKLQTDQQLAFIDLTQLLQFERINDFDVSASGLDTICVLPGNADMLYSTALNNYPAIRSAQYRIEKARADIGVARAGYWPTIDLSGGYYNGYYFYSNLKDGAKNVSFSKQLYQNQQQIIGATLSVPLFSRFDVKHKVQTATLNMQQQQLTLETVKLTFYKTIQQTYCRAVAAKGKLRSLQKEEEASQIAYEAVLEKFEVGKANTFEVNEKQTALSKAASDRIQAKYDYLFACKIIELYVQ